MNKVTLAIHEATQFCDCVIDAHVSQIWWEGWWPKRRDLSTLSRAKAIFMKVGLSHHKQAALFYLNRSRRRIALVTTPEIHQILGPKVISDLLALFRRDLHSTHFENALSMAIRTLAVTLKQVSLAKQPKTKAQSKLDPSLKIGLD